MFNYSQKISVLDRPQNIVSAKMRLDTDGLPSVLWISSNSDCNFLNFCRYDGTSWNFNDNNFEISKTVGFFDFLAYYSDTFFVYNYTKDTGPGTYLEYRRYSFLNDKFYDPVSLDSGNVQFCKPFVYISLVYFLYIIDGAIYVRNHDSVAVLPQMSSLSMTGNITKISASCGRRYFLLSWCVQSGTTVTVRSCVFDFMSLTWGSVNDLMSFESASYNITTDSNKLGDVAYPSGDYKPFYLAVARREQSEIKISLVEFDTSDGFNLWAVYNKRYFSFTTDFTLDPVVNLSVYGKRSCLSVVCEDYISLYADDVSYGYMYQFSPGKDLLSGVVEFVPVLTENFFHYLYCSDNLSYGYTSIPYTAIRSNCTFCVSNSSSTYITPSSVPELGGCSVLDFVTDRSFQYPFLYLVKQQDSSRIYFYDCNSNSYIPDLSVPTTESVGRMVFDRRYSKCIYIDSVAAMHVYDLSSKKKTDYSSFNGIEIKSPFDVCFDDKEIFVSDTQNNRIVVLDRYSYEYLRTISNSNMILPYSCVCGTDSTIYVKCYNSGIYPVVYQFSKIGDLIRSFPSYSSYPIGQYDYEPWYFSCSSFSSGFVAMIFKNSNRVLIINDSTGAWIERVLSGYVLYGITVDNEGGHVFISAVNQSLDNVIVEVDPNNGGVIHEYPAYGVGLLSVVNKDSVGVKAQFEVLRSKYSSSSRANASYRGTDSTSSPVALSRQTNVTEDKRDYSFTKVGYEAGHVTDRFVSANVWHFRFNGLYSEKVSIDPNLSFASMGNGDITRVPVFCWDFEEQTFIDTFFVCDGTTLKKMALWYERGNYYLQEVSSTTDVNRVVSVFVKDGKVFVSSGGYLSVFSYDSLNRLKFQYFADDLKVYDYRDGYVWAGSKGRGYIYKININDMSVFDTIESREAPVNMYWADYFGKYVVHCENSLRFLDAATLETQSFFDINDYIIRDISVNNDKIAICSLSYDKIPYRGDYSTEEAFLVDVEKRKYDRVCVFSPNNKIYTFEATLPYDFVSDSINFTNDTLTVFGSDSSNVYIKTYDVVSGAFQSYPYSTTEKPVEMIYMPVAMKNFSVISDGSILDWSSGTMTAIFSRSSYRRPADVVLASNGLLVSRSDVTTQPSSSSSSSSSSASGIPQFRSVQIVVGDGPGKANKWDSGEVVTAKKCILYGGGNNLEPGQKYYVAIRAKTNSGVWCQYSSLEFTMPHFENFEFNPASSSSSSSNSIKFTENELTLYPGLIEDLGTFLSYGIVFEASSGEFSYLVISGETFKVQNVSGSLVFDMSGSQQHTFTFSGETFVLYSGFDQYAVTLISTETIIFSIYRM